MNETSLRLETFSGSSSSFRSISISSPRMISSLSSPLSSKSSTCSDRFIPCRSSSRLHSFGSKFTNESNKNMLRFKTEHSGPDSPYSPSILGQDSGFSSDAC
ncbi:hypothetical protein CRYUN_Cryun09bG0099300 [Craigia yunnanensis]